MAKINGAESIKESKYQFGATTPKEFDFSKLELGKFLANPNAPENESFLRKYLNYVQAHNAPIHEALKEGKAALKETKREVYNLKRACKAAETPEEQALLEAELKGAKRTQWAQIRKNIRLAFSLA